MKAFLHYIPKFHSRWNHSTDEAVFKYCPFECAMSQKTFLKIPTNTNSFLHLLKQCIVPFDVYLNINYYRDLRELLETILSFRREVWGLLRSWPRGGRKRKKARQPISRLQVCSARDIVFTIRLAASLNAVDSITVATDLKCWFYHILCDTIVPYLAFCLTSGLLCPCACLGLAPQGFATEEHVIAVFQSPPDLLLRMNLRTA